MGRVRVGSMGSRGPMVWGCLLLPGLPLYLLPHGPGTHWLLVLLAPVCFQTFIDLSQAGISAPL